MENQIYNNIQKAQEGDRNALLAVITKLDPMLKAASYSLFYEDAYNC